MRERLPKNRSATNEVLLCKEWGIPISMLVFQGKHGPLLCKCSGLFEIIVLICCTMSAVLCTLYLCAFFVYQYSIITFIQKESQNNSHKLMWFLKNPGWLPLANAEGLRVNTCNAVNAIPGAALQIQKELLYFKVLLHMLCFELVSI